MSRPTVGVLAVQGDVREHVAMLRDLGADALGVRRRQELAGVDGIILPGGESTTMIRLLRAFDLLAPLRERISSGLPAYGSCAGMILLADRLLDGEPGQETVGGLDITARRNAFGRQVDSFETDLELAGVAGGRMHAVFIRAPWAEVVGPDVEVLGVVPEGPARGRVVAVRQGHLLATSFHPEVGGDDRVHRLFLDLVEAGRVRGGG